ncbi:oxytocin receptor-like [Saccostrea echinata]|uniref:oxytocin receptor-like n=1 Tax=Saccostrea echinata TaxID=191078 RepID=UPI002A82705A|nr:oxytocin receptor-like [Saccostrea echinata]
MMESARNFSEQHSERLLPNTIAILIAAAFGIFGNFLVILVYSRYVQDKTASRFFIPILAFVDLAGCISNVIQYHIDNTMRYPSEILCKIFSFLIILTGGMSAHLIFAIALQRYLIICRPFGPQMTTKSCKIATMIICLISVGYSAPIVKFSGIHEPSSVTMCHFDDGTNGNSVMIPYFGTFLILSFINIIVTSALYIPVIKTIYKTLSPPKRNRINTIPDDNTIISSKETQDLSSENTGITMADLPQNILRTHNTEPSNTLTTDGNREQRARRNISVMFLVIITVYVVSYLTSLFTQVYTFVDPEMDLRGFKLNVYDFCLRFNLLNHIANPYIYWIFDNKFRNELRLLCCEKFFRRYSFSL